MSSLIPEDYVLPQVAQYLGLVPANAQICPVGKGEALTVVGKGKRLVVVVSQTDDSRKYCAPGVCVL